MKKIKRSADKNCSALKDHLKGGLDKFINNKELKKINRNKKESLESYKISQKLKYNYNNLDHTKRVIFPENNYEKKIERKNKKRFCSAENNDRHVTNGTLQSLFDRTPDKFIIPNGRKKLNSSYEENILFYEDKKDMWKIDNDRIFGVPHKVRVKNANEESDPIDIFKGSNNRKRGRKRFINLEQQKTSIF